MKLVIKNMVCLCCKTIVRSEMENLGLHLKMVELGEVEIEENLLVHKYNQLKAALLKYGLELMEDKKSMLVEKIKNIIVGMIHYSEESPKTNFSDYLRKKLLYDYNYISSLFSEVKGTTIERTISITL